MDPLLHPPPLYSLVVLKYSLLTQFLRLSGMRPPLLHPPLLPQLHPPPYFTTPYFTPPVLTRCAEVFLVDTVPQAVRYASHYGATDLARSHLPQLRHALVTIERRVRRTDDVRGVFERTYNVQLNTITANKLFHKHTFSIFIRYSMNKHAIFLIQIHFTIIILAGMAVI